MNPRRLAVYGCLAATLVGHAASAASYDVMVIRQRFTSQASASLQEQREMVDQNFQSLCDILNRCGTRYGVFNGNEGPNTRAVASYIQSGIFPRATGLTDTASCVIFSSYMPAGGNGLVTMDSSFRLVKSGFNVPVCFLIDNVAELGSLSGTSYMDDAGVASLRDSTGVSGPKPTPGISGAPVLADGSKRMWINNEFMVGFIRNASQSPAGGLRPLLYASTSGEGAIITQMNWNSIWPDSLPHLNTQVADTMYVWDRLWNISTLPSAKPTTFVSWAGIGLNITDSLYNAGAVTYRPPAEGSLDILMFGLAHFDSLTGGKIFGRMKHPLQIAFTVDGALTRNDRRRIPGILNADTSTFYAVLDSIAALNIPITFGANIDSASAYARDVIKLRSIPLARFTPQSWKGQQRGASGDTTNGSGSGNASKNNLVDIFGRYRNRAFVGDTSATADSSLYGLLVRGRFRCDSIFQRPSSKTLLAPYDDYSPKNMSPWNGMANQGTPDSLVYAFAKAGFEAVRSNNRWSNSVPGRGSEGRTNPRGWFHDQGVIRDNIGGRDFKIVCDGGYPLQGGLRQAKVYVDSTNIPPSALLGHIEFWRVVQELLVNRRYDFDVVGNQAGLDANWYPYRDINQHTEDFQSPDFSYAASSYSNGPGNVMMLHCSDLSGNPSNPARIGWWHMRHIVSWARICNSAAGRNIFSFVYPEQIEPLP